MRLLQEYIRLVLETYTVNTQEISALLKQICDKFPDDFYKINFVSGSPLIPKLLTPKMSDYFYDRVKNHVEFYNTCVSNYIMTRNHNAYCGIANVKIFNDAPNNYVQDELLKYDILVYFDNYDRELHAIDRETLTRLLKIANSSEKFIVLLKHVTKEI